MSAGRPIRTGFGQPEAMCLPGWIHLIGICGRASAPIAVSLAQKGIKVTGSDLGAFPPMDGVLREAGITFTRRPSPHSLPRGAELIVVAGGMTPAHPEFAVAIDQGRRWMHFAEFLSVFFLQRSRNVVVAGTNGKTTSTALLAWLLECGGMRPDYLIGGKARDFPCSARFEHAGLAVLEGDEYWTGHGDVRPKFLHYDAGVALITNIQHDHPEVYADAWSYLFPFKHLIDLMPKSGLVILNADDPNCAALKPRPRAKVVTVGFGRESQHRITRVRRLAWGSRFSFLGRRFELPLIGRMNVQNAAMAVVAARAVGMPLRLVARAMPGFAGVEGRQQLVCDHAGIRVFLDEAYHPHSLAAVLAALRAHHPRRRLVVLIRPRATSRTDSGFAVELVESLAAADLVLMANLPAGFRGLSCFDLGRTMRRLRRRGVVARAADELVDFLPGVPRLLRRGDVVLLSVFNTDHAFAGALSAVLEKLGS